jgi:hypothetical protein
MLTSPIKCGVGACCHITSLLCASVMCRLAVDMCELLALAHRRLQMRCVLKRSWLLSWPGWSRSGWLRAPSRYVAGKVDSSGSTHKPLLAKKLQHRQV